MGLKTARVTNALKHDPRAEKTIVEALGLGGIRIRRLTLYLREDSPPTVEAEIYVDDEALKRLPGALSGLAEGREFGPAEDCGPREHSMKRVSDEPVPHV